MANNKILPQQMATIMTYSVCRLPIGIVAGIEPLSWLLLTSLCYPNPIQPNPINTNVVIAMQ